jgi:2-polyprenyl-6-methoxyphenol hydroxylase-like FAD-dependent oxidoreductase
MTAARHAIIVGGSLAGLASAIALADRGIEVTVLERAGAAPRSGGAIGVAPGHLREVTGLPTRPGASAIEAESWQSLRARLLAAANTRASVTVRHDAAVSEVGQDDAGVWALLPDETVRGDVLIGADGHRSLVRAAVAPDHADAAFAGYALWLGIARESDLPPVRHWPQWPDILDGANATMIGYPLEGEDGSRAPGERRLGWAWFDATRNPLLRSTGAVRDDVVRHSLRASSIAPATLTDLRRDAHVWPEPWRSAVNDAIDRHEVTGVPIAEYVPRTLVSGRIVLVGNAAHLPTPMTGTGFDASLDDAATLADTLTSGRDVASALAEYESRRLPAAAAIVTAGTSFSRAFGRP